MRVRRLHCVTGCICEHTYISIYIRICICSHIYISIYIRICICIHIYIYIFIYISRVHSTFLCVSDYFCYGECKCILFVKSLYLYLRACTTAHHGNAWQHTAILQYTVRLCNTLQSTPVCMRARIFVFYNVHI